MGQGCDHFNVMPSHTCKPSPMPHRSSSARRARRSHRRASSSTTSSPHVPSNIYSTVARLITYGPRHDFEMPFSVTDRFPTYGTGFFVGISTKTSDASTLQRQE